MTDKEKHIQKNIARQLLKLNDPPKRRKAVLTNAILFACCFIALGLILRWNSPLSVMPRTFFSVMMGFFLFSMISARRFPFVGKYINWHSVERDAQQTDEPALMDQSS